MAAISSSVWDQALDVLRDSMDEELYSTWVDPIVCVSYADGELTLRVPSLFFRNWLISNYQETIEQAIEQVVHRQINIHYALATEDELAGQEVFFGKATCSVCHPAPFYLDDKMHDLHLEEFLDEPGDGPIKTFTLRGIKDSPPYMHDGRCLTLEDTVEFFNIVLRLNLNETEKRQLAAFMKTL